MAVSTLLVQIFANTLNAQDGINRKTYRIFGIIGLMFCGTFFFMLTLSLLIQVDVSQLISAAVAMTLDILLLQIVLPLIVIHNNQQLYEYVQNCFQHVVKY